MPREIQEPEVEFKPWAGGEAVECRRHPAYGQIVASRVSGATALYGSDFVHHHFVTIKISRSEMQRNLSRDWHHGREEIIEVALSEAQWASFVSSMNVGSGVCCTIERESGKGLIPGLPDPKPAKDQFSKEVKQATQEAVDLSAQLESMIDEMGLPKGKAEKLKAQARVVRSKLQSSIPFVVESADKHMEKTVERAKIEVNAYATTMVQRAGLEAIAGGAMPIALEDKRA